MDHPEIPRARDIMARSLVTLRPGMRVLDAAELLLKRKISGAPVVNEAGELLGLLSEYDCLRALANSEYQQDSHDEVVVVAALMTHPCHTIPPEMDLFAIAHEFVTLRVRRLPVVEGEQLVGQVSRRDVLRAAHALRRQLVSQKHYPDYPAGREPIRDYPKGR